MKHVLAAAGFMIVACLIYAAFAFTTWHADPSKWPEIGRDMYCFSTAMVGGGVFAYVELET